MDKIPFNKPYLSGKELYYISQTIHSGKTSGNQHFTKKVHSFFNQTFGFRKSLLTTSCTDALEMSALLVDIQPGDEVILPSYTFVSTANAFVLRGASLVFADSYTDNPNINSSQIESLITTRTKAIVVVHYAGIACNMDEVMALANKYGLKVIEDAAQAIDSYYNGKPLGTFGHLSAFSFHETKNIICGEGGLLGINDDEYSARAEIIWEKGTNRSAFFRGEVDKYGWVDVGSSFLASDILAAFLFAQLEHLEDIQTQRKRLWSRYHENLATLEQEGLIMLPQIPDYASNNAHMFFIVCKTLEDRSGLISFLQEQNIHAVFHYLSLHKSPFYKDKHDGRDLANCDRFADCLVRLPLFYELPIESIDLICKQITNYFK